MSNPEKLRASSAGRPDSELTKLKAAWRPLTDDARAFWLELFLSDTSQAQIRASILAKLKINLRFDKQLTQFRQWAIDQEKRDAQAERLQENENRIKADHPNWGLDRVREEVIKASYFESLASGDHKLGLKTVVQDLNVKKVILDWEKFHWDAAVQARKHLPALKAIAADRSLSEDQKTQAFMEKLFGSPEEKK